MKFSEVIVATRPAQLLPAEDMRTGRSGIAVRADRGRDIVGVQPAAVAHGALCVTTVPVVTVRGTEPPYGGLQLIGQTRRGCSGVGCRSGLFRIDGEEFLWRVQDGAEDKSRWVSHPALRRPAQDSDRDLREIEPSHALSTERGTQRDPQLLLVNPERVP